MLSWVSWKSSGSLEEVQAKFGEDVRVTHVACLVKVKADKSTKVRLIVDMLRSGVNGLATMRERIVLPRVADLAFGAVDLLEAWAGHWTESRRLVDEFAWDGGGAASRSGSLRVHFFCGAAAVARLTQATFLPWEAQLQCYVDDPGLSIAGLSRCERSCIIAMTPLFWSIIGIPVNWKKPRRGRRLDWIGFEFHIRLSGLDVTM